MSEAFTSRWVERPEHVADDEDVGTLPQGFRAAGVAAGIKDQTPPALDLGLLVSDAPDTTSAARFTRSGVLAGPVLLTQERCRLDGIRAVVANSGNATSSAADLANLSVVRIASPNVSSP